MNESESNACSEENTDKLSLFTQDANHSFSSLSTDTATFTTTTNTLPELYTSNLVYSSDGETKNQAATKTQNGPANYPSSVLSDRAISERTKPGEFNSLESLFKRTQHTSFPSDSVDTNKYLNSKDSEKSSKSTFHSRKESFPLQNSLSLLHNEGLSITIPHHFPPFLEGTSALPSLLMTSSSHSLTPSSPIVQNLPPVPPTTECLSSHCVSKILFLSDDGPEDEKIDVCSVKETRILTHNENIYDKNHKNPIVKLINEDVAESSKKDAGTSFFSHLGSQCSRTVPSLMKFYSRHKRSLSTSLSVTLAVSGQATPPCSPISPGTLTVIPSLSQRSSLEASTMTSPTDRTLLGPTESLSIISNDEQQKSVKSLSVSCAAPSPIAALTLLTIPTLKATDESASLSNMSSLITVTKQNGLEETKENKIVNSSDGEIDTCASSVPTENSSVEPPVCTIPPGITFPAPWQLPQNTIPHPGSYWLHASQFSGIDTSAGLGLGYHVARDPLTGHLFILSRPHPLSDPNGHGLVWAGYGSVPPPPMMMTSQQLLLDPRYRPTLHPPPPIMHVHHALPSLHPHQQQQQQQRQQYTVKNENSSFTLKNEETINSSISVLEVATNQTSELPIPPILPQNLSSHFLYPPTTIPYYYSQPTHPNPFNISAFTHQSTSSNIGLQSNLLTPCSSIPFTSSPPTLTTTSAESDSISVNASNINPVLRSLSLSPKDASNQASLSNFQDNSLSCEPPMDLTQYSLRSLSSELRPTSETKCFLQTEEPVVRNQALRIKKEIKEELRSSFCLTNEESKGHEISHHNLFSIKVESNHEYQNSQNSILNDKNKTSREIHDTSLSKKPEIMQNIVDDFEITNTSSSIDAKNSREHIENTNSKISDAIDSSGLELLLQTFLQHGDRLAPSPQPKDSDQDSLSSHGEQQMPHLERATNTPSPRFSPASFESQPPVLTPFTIPTETESPPLSPDRSLGQSINFGMDSLPSPKPSGLSVLCALAEQRILEEQQQNSCSALSSLAEVASTTPSVPMIPLSLRVLSEQSCNSNKLSNLLTEPLHYNNNNGINNISMPIQDILQTEANNFNDIRNADVNRNYKSPESERDARAFIANKVCQYQKELSTDVGILNYQMDDMDAVEIDMKMKLADLQRQYKRKQRELSRLQPRKEFSTGTFKRRRGRPPKIRTCSPVMRMKRKVGRPLKKIRLDTSPSVEKDNLDLESLHIFEKEAHNAKSFMQSPTSDSPISMQSKAQSNFDINNVWQPKMEESSDEEITNENSNALSLDSSCSSIFKSPCLIMQTKQEETDEEHINNCIQTEKYEKTETLVESSTSDAEFHSVSSSSKKRKPGRPKKHSLTKYEATETIVAKKPKAFEFLLLSHKTKLRPKLKAELKIREREQEEDLSNNHFQGTQQEILKEEKDDHMININLKANSNQKKNMKDIHRRGAPIGRTPLSRNTLLRDKEKRKSVFEKNSRMQELFRSLKRYSTIAAAEHDESEDEKEYQSDETEKICSRAEEDVDNNTNNISSKILSNEETDKVNLISSKPLSVFIESEVNLKEEPINVFEVCPAANDISVSVDVMRMQNTIDIQESIEFHEILKDQIKDSRAVDDFEKERESSVCSLQIDDLIPGARILILQDGLLYAGNLSPITPPDVYGIHLDGERGTRQHICCQEELLNQAWKEVKPGSTRFLTEGTRVCAFWSQQYRGLYPGCVAPASSPTHEGNHNLVNVEFDDGDSGRIHVDDIRLLPQDYPVIEYDPNPLMTLNKRKRRPTEDDGGDSKLTSNINSKYLNKCNAGTLESTHDLNKGSSKNIIDEISKRVYLEVNSESSMDDNFKETKRKQKRKKIQKKKPSLSLDERKRHKRKKRCSETSLHRHRHKRKRKHKQKNSSSIFPHVEQGDNELRMRIKSPPPFTESHISLEESSTENEANKSNESTYQPLCRHKRCPSEKSKIAPFLLERQLWRWSGKGYRRPGSKGKGKKEFYKEIVRGKEHIRVGDCAVFLSSGSHERPFIGKIDFLWEAWGGNMVVKVRWFYHPDETIGTERKLTEPRGALFSSSHTDENDVQTISHMCHVVPLAEYRIRRAEVDRKHGSDYENYDLYYLAGFYDPVYSRITMEPGVS